MNTKHTPGPWKLITTPNDPDFTHEVTGVCATYINNHSEANARLIAAAPELLEACQYYVNLLETEIYAGELIRKASFKIKEAIKKATE